jgi:hypothetical protein
MNANPNADHNFKLEHELADEQEKKRTFDSGKKPARKCRKPEREGYPGPAPAINRVKRVKRVTVPDAIHPATPKNGGKLSNGYGKPSKKKKKKVENDV